VEFTNRSKPKIVVSFAPHQPTVASLATLLKEIRGAHSSVIFAVMELKTSKGEVVETLGSIHNDQKIFSYGISDNVNSDDNTVNGTTVYTPKTKGGELVYSKENPEKFPQPFSPERAVTGGAAHIVHHKFVVIDFNGTYPVVFCGSSNLAQGGEEANGDNLIAIYGHAVATAFAIEGIRLVDHYAFAAALKRNKGEGKPLRLKFNEEKWWAPYYVPDGIKEKERKLFSR
jgi:phosphatidylserine/phosphatidylglycerophosphate/cardiolipin synthase-like enzyme